MALSKYWLNHIEGWQRSGLSQAAYCRQHDLNANSFTGRLSEFRKQANSAFSELIPVQVNVDEEHSSTNLLVFTVKDYRLELPNTERQQKQNGLHKEQLCNIFEDYWASNCIHQY